MKKRIVAVALVICACGALLMYNHARSSAKTVSNEKTASPQHTLADTYPQDAAGNEQIKRALPPALSTEQIAQMRQNLANAHKEAAANREIVKKSQEDMRSLAAAIDAYLVDTDAIK